MNLKAKTTSRSFSTSLSFLSMKIVRRRKLGQLMTRKSRRNPTRKDVPDVERDLESDIGVGHVMERYAQHIVGTPKGSYAKTAQKRNLSQILNPSRRSNSAAKISGHKNVLHANNQYIWAMLYALIATITSQEQQAMQTISTSTA